MRQQRTWILAIVVGLLAGCASRQAALQEKLDDVLRNRAAPDAMLAARVVELPSHRELYASGDNDPVIPASNMKLLVTSAALDFFGPDHAFNTYLALDGDDLWIIGTGDPAIGDDSIAGRRTTSGNTMTVLENWSRAEIPRHHAHQREALLFRRCIRSPADSSDLAEG